MATAKQIEHCRAIARAGGLARAKAFTSEYQSAAARARLAKPGALDQLRKSGKKGYVCAMAGAGFTDTTFMLVNQDLLNDDQPPF